MGRARTARFEVVRSDAGWFARFRAANGRKVWQTEVYERRVRVIGAIELITGHRVYEVRGALGVSNGFERLEVRDVDGVEKVAVNDAGQTHDVLVKYVDERGQA